MRTGTWIESRVGGRDFGPYADEVAGSEMMDNLGLNDDGWKIVVYTVDYWDLPDDQTPDGWHVWDRDGYHVRGPFDCEQNAEDGKTGDDGEWVGEVDGGIRDESYWVES